MMSEKQGDDDMQMIGNFLSFASRGDRVGLNQMLRNGISPDVQDYDRRSALHLAASEGHAPIVELLLHYKANVNLIDRWNRTPLTDARLYGHRDICRILEVNGGKDIDDKEFINDQPTTSDQAPMTVRNEQDSNEVIDISELNAEDTKIIDQGVFGESRRVKWRGTWVVKTVMQRQIIQHPVKMILSSKDNTLLQELRHPNILQFLGSIVQGEEMILITEYLPKDNLHEILNKKGRLDFPTALRYALDIARGMNYLHEHKPRPIVHNNLDLRNLLQDESGHLKIGEYWVQMLYEQIQPNEVNCQINENEDNHSNEIKKDVLAFGIIFYQMLEGVDINIQMKLPVGRCPNRIHELMQNCTDNDVSKRPDFFGVITTLEEVSIRMEKACIGQYCP